MKDSDRVYDTGLQLERTLLAWRRTALAVAVVSAAGIRFTAPVMGWLAIVLGAVGACLAATAYLGTGIRYRQLHDHLYEHHTHPADGWAPTTLSLAVGLLGLLALSYVLLDQQ